MAGFIQVSSQLGSLPFKAVMVSEFSGDSKGASWAPRSPDVCCGTLRPQPLVVSPYVPRSTDWGHLYHCGDSWGAVPLWTFCPVFICLPSPMWASTRSVAVCDVWCQVGLQSSSSLLGFQRLSSSSRWNGVGKTGNALQGEVACTGTTLPPLLPWTLPFLNSWHFSCTFCYLAISSTLQMGRLVEPPFLYS